MKTFGSVDTFTVPNTGLAVFNHIVPVNHLVNLRLRKQNKNITRKKLKINLNNRYPLEIKTCLTFQNIAQKNLTIPFW